MQAKSQQFRSVAYAVVLAITWYFTSTALSVYNKKVLGRKYGVLGGQPFPAPMLMVAIQFAMQYGLARSALALGCKRTLSAPLAALPQLRCTIALQSIEPVVSTFLEAKQESLRHSRVLSQQK
jgi:hypothetical protein